jgi:hypothetical protein
MCILRLNNIMTYEFYIACFLVKLELMQIYTAYVLYSEQNLYQNLDFREFILLMDQLHEVHGNQISYETYQISYTLQVKLQVQEKSKIKFRSKSRSRTMHKGKELLMSSSIYQKIQNSDHTSNRSSSMNLHSLTDLTD